MLNPRKRHMRTIWTCAVLLAIPQWIYPATITSCDEAGLRTALAAGGTINFACDGTIPLASTLVVTQNVTLDGTGHSVILDGQGAVRVLFVNSGVQFGMTNVTVANGATNAPGAGL